MGSRNSGWRATVCLLVFLYGIALLRLTSDFIRWSRGEAATSVPKPSKEHEFLPDSYDEEDIISVATRKPTSRPPQNSAPEKRKVSLFELASRVSNERFDDDEDEDGETGSRRTSKPPLERQGGVSDLLRGSQLVEFVKIPKVNFASDDEDGEDKPSEIEEEDEGRSSRASSFNPTAWKNSFESTQCKRFRSLPTGHAKTHNVGQGQRALCSQNATDRRTVEYRTEIAGSVDVSFEYKAIYIPVMKAGSQMFQEVFRKKLKGRRILDRELLYYLRKYELELDDFFIFTFVRDPFATFVSAYGEVSKYTANNRTVVKGFSSILDTPENEPKRALTALEDIKRGTFHGLVPAHMHTQLWKISRCLADKDRTDIPIHFVGHLENLDADWRYVEQMLKLSHQELPVIHSSGPKRRLPYDPPSQNSRFSSLTENVCEYYKADFACFGFDDSLCRQRRR